MRHAWPCILIPTHMRVGVYEGGRTPARAARDAGAALMISPIFSPRVPKAFSSTRQLTYESRIGFRDLWVRRSLVEEDKYFTKKGLSRGWGLFLPEDRGGVDPWVGAWVVMVVVVTGWFGHPLFVCAGWTEELAFTGPHVMHVSYDQIMPWQREYAIQDTFQEGMVFVPDNPSLVCKLFRVQHCAHDPTHELAQVDKNKCVLVPLRRMRPGEELTFDYFGTDEMVSSCTVCPDSSTDPDHTLSLSSQSVGSQVVLTGNGIATTTRLLAKLEARVKMIGDEEVCESLAF